jgi:hypothetical protein
MRQGPISKGVLHVIYRYASLAVYGINYTSLDLVRVRYSSSEDQRSYMFSWPHALTPMAIEKET